LYYYICNVKSSSLINDREFGEIDLYDDRFNVYAYSNIELNIAVLEIHVYTARVKFEDPNYLVCTVMYCYGSSCVYVGKRKKQADCMRGIICVL